MRRKVFRFNERACIERMNVMMKKGYVIAGAYDEKIGNKKKGMRTS